MAHVQPCGATLTSTTMPAIWCCPLRDSNCIAPPGMRAFTFIPGTPWGTTTVPGGTSLTGTAGIWSVALVVYNRMSPPSARIPYAERNCAMQDGAARQAATAGNPESARTGSAVRSDKALDPTADHRATAQARARRPHQNPPATTTPFPKPASIATSVSPTRPRQEGSLTSLESEGHYPNVYTGNSMTSSRARDGMQRAEAVV